MIFTTPSALAFKVRKFPDNFNESKLIFLHTLSTSFLWLALSVLHIRSPPFNYTYIDIAH